MALAPGQALEAPCLMAQEEPDQAMAATTGTWQEGEPSRATPGAPLGRDQAEVLYQAEALSW